MKPGEGIVVVTGASGYVGSHVVRELLARGHRVRGTVRDPRDPNKTPFLRKLAEGLPGELELVRADLAEDRSFDDAVAGARGVVHTATVAALSAKDPENTIVRPSVDGTRNVLGSIERAGTVEVLVHTSSVAAIVSHHVADRTYSEQDWSDDATLQSDPYGLGKREAERIVHAFGKERGLRVAAINPSLVLGPVFTEAHITGSVSVVRDLVVGTFPACPQLAFGLVDAREVAWAHAEALERPDIHGRFALSTDSLFMQEIAQELQRQHPEWKVNTGRLPNFAVWIVSLFDPRVDRATLRQMLGRKVHYDNTRSRDLLGVRYRPVSQTLADAADSLITQGFASPRRR